jgi:hypothetical protein
MADHDASGSGAVEQAGASDNAPKARTKVGKSDAQRVLGSASARIDHATQVVQNQISSQLFGLVRKSCASFALFVLLEDGRVLSVTSDDLDALPEWIKADQTLGAVASRYQLDKALQLQLSAQKRGWKDLPDSPGLPNRLVRRLLTAGEAHMAAAQLCTVPPPACDTASLFHSTRHSVVAVMPGHAKDLPVESSSGDAATLAAVQQKYPWWPLSAWKKPSDMSAEECQLVFTAVVQHCHSRRTQVMEQLRKLDGLSSVDRLMVETIVTHACEYCSSPPCAEVMTVPVSQKRHQWQLLAAARVASACRPCQSVCTADPIHVTVVTVAHVVSATRLLSTWTYL